MALLWAKKRSEITVSEMADNKDSSLERDVRLMKRDVIDFTLSNSSVTESVHNNVTLKIRTEAKQKSI